MSASTISVHELQAGYVLLSKGCDGYAELITQLDGSRYSHASLWTGDGVVEAVREGVVHGPLERSLAAHPRQYIDVFRWKPTQSQRAHAPAFSQVIEAALKHCGKQYAMSELRLVGLLALATQFGLTRAMREALRLRLTDLTAALVRANQEAPRPAMICSELVARAFFESDPPEHRNALQLKITGDRMVRGQLDLRGAGPIADSDPELAEMLDQARRLLAKDAAVRPAPPRRDASRDTRVLAGWDFPLHFVTPRDLYTSPELELVAALDVNASRNLPA